MNLIIRLARGHGILLTDYYFFGRKLTGDNSSFIPTNFVIYSSAQEVEEIVDEGLSILSILTSDNKLFAIVKLEKGIKL